MLEKVKTEWEKWTRLTPTDLSYDRTLLWLFILLLSIGFIAVSSASMPLASGVKYNDPFYFVMRDGMYVLLGVMVFWGCLYIPMRTWEKYTYYLLGLSLLLLAAVLVLGRPINGAIRWIPIGSFNFQPAELAKLAIICYFARFYAIKFEEIRASTWSFWRPGVIFGVFAFLLRLQPDLGSIVVLFFLSVSMLFIMGAKLLQFIVVGLLGFAGLAIAILNSAYRSGRWSSFIDPSSDPFGDSYQLTKSILTFAQGQWFGRGVGNSVNKLGYLPEAHTDFVTAVIGEEFGFIGMSVLVLLLFALIWRALSISANALKLDARFNGFLAFGIAMLIFIQGFVNLGMALGALPTKGLTFPLVSYGGSSLIMMSIAVALLMRIDYESRALRIRRLNTEEE